MRRTRPQLVALCILFSGWQALVVRGVAAEDKPQKGTPDQRFETLLSEAMKAPENADWKALRGAFSETTHYHPYSIDVDTRLKEIARAIGRGETKESEAALLKLLERERFMRFDTVAMLMMLYQKIDQPEKAQKYEKILDGILGVLEYPKAGTSFEDPIPVLFIQEEYLVTTNMPIGGRGSTVHGGHHFDVFEIEADGSKPARTVYFNIDLPRNALSKSLLKAK